MKSQEQPTVSAMGMSGTNGRSLAAVLSAALGLLAFGGPAWAGPAASQPASEAVGQLEAMQAAFADVAARVGPSVVAITAKRRLSSLWEQVPLTSMSEEDLRRGNLDPLTLTAGSGMVLRDNGLILTNQHVIEDAVELTVLLQGGREYPARIVGSDARSDLAVLKIEAAGLPPVSIAPPGQVRRGHWTIAMGNPYGITSESWDGQASMTLGIASAVGRLLHRLGADEDRYYGNLIQTSAPVDQGNSGGPLLNIRGEVIGIVTAIKSRSGSGEGFNFAIPLNERTLRIIAQLEAGKTVEYGYLGVDVITPTADQRCTAGASENVGVLIDGVDEKGPAAQAGLQKGDLVVRLGAKEIANNEDFVEWVGGLAVQEPVTMEVMRAGKKLVLTARLSKRELVHKPKPVVRTARGWRGLRVAAIPRLQRRTLGLTDAGGGVVIVSVEPGSPADRAGLSPNRVILTIEDVRVDTPADVARLAEKFDETVRLKISGQEQPVILEADPATPTTVPAP